jgi:predicted TIM-barrel fold metal-dependent hydrolase
MCRSFRMRRRAERLEPSLARELSRQANDTLAAAISKHPDRFLGFATLPMLDPTAAARELERTVHDLGFVGAMINGHVNGRYLDDKFFWSVFECAEALGVPIYLLIQVPPKPVVDACYSGFAPEVSAFLSIAGGGCPTKTDPRRMSKKRLLDFCGFSGFRYWRSTLWVLILKCRPVAELCARPA